MRPSSVTHRLLALAVFTFAAELGAQAHGAAEEFPPLTGGDAPAASDAAEPASSPQQAPDQAPSPRQAPDQAASAQPAPYPAWESQRASQEPAPPLYAHQSSSRPYEPAPPAPPEESAFPSFSIRLDPLNALIEGRAGLELEVELASYFTLELVPEVVLSTEPPALNLSGRRDNLSRHSNGLSVLSGGSLGAGFWLQGQTFKGYVLRAVITNHAYTYRTVDSTGTTFDEVDHTSRLAMILFGSHSRYGAFTIAGAIGLGWELNRPTRCFDDAGYATRQCDDEDLLIALDRQTVLSLYGPLHPLYLSVRFSLGFVF